MYEQTAAMFCLRILNRHPNLFQIVLFLSFLVGFKLLLHKKIFCCLFKIVCISAKCRTIELRFQSNFFCMFEVSLMCHQAKKKLKGNIL